MGPVPSTPVFWLSWETPVASTMEERSKGALVAWATQQYTLLVMVEVLRTCSTLWLSLDPVAVIVANNMSS